MAGGVDLVKDTEDHKSQQRDYLVGDPSILIKQGTPSTSSLEDVSALQSLRRPSITGLIQSPSSELMKPRRLPKLELQTPTKTNGKLLL